MIETQNLYNTQQMNIYWGILESVGLSVCLSVYKILYLLLYLGFIDTFFMYWFQPFGSRIISARTLASFVKVSAFVKPLAGILSHIQWQTLVSIDIDVKNHTIN